MEFYRTAVNFLETCGLKISRNFIKGRMLSHPDYPSIISLLDTLDELQIPYETGVYDKEKWEDFSFPTLLHITQKNKQDFLSVSSKSIFKKQREQIMEHWDGIALNVKATISIFHKEHNELLQNEIIRKISFWSLIGITFLLTAFSVLQASKVRPFILLLTAWGGASTAALLIARKLGTISHISEKLCSSAGDSSCDSVLSNEKFSWKYFGLEDAALIFFSTQVLFLSASAQTRDFPSSLKITGITIIPALALSLYLIYYQWKIIKQWCRICLLISAAVWIYAIVLLSAYNTLSNTSITTNIIVRFSITVLSLFVVWLVVKSLLVDNFRLQKISIEELKWKRDPDLFFSQLKLQRKVSDETWIDDLTLGKSNAPIRLIVICNPYCGPCAKAHENLEELLTIYPELISITIRFAVEINNRIDKRLLSTQHILYAAENLKKSGQTVTLQNHPLSVWYRENSLDIFKTKFPETPSADYNFTLLTRYKNWISEAKITHTPTIFINGYEKPKKFITANLKYHLGLVVEKIIQASSVANEDYTV